MRHHKKLKKGLALALCVLCLASLCAGAALAAAGDIGTERIDLKYDNNLAWDYVEKDGLKQDTTNTAYILTGSKVTVQMSLGDDELPMDDGKKKALLVEPKNTGADASIETTITGTGRRGEFDVGAELKDGVTEMDTPVQFNLKANISAITPENGYKGTVRATSPIGNASGAARLLTAMPFADNNQIQIVVKHGETAQSKQVGFEIVPDGCSGAFESYKNGTVSVDTENSDIIGKPNVAGKTITIIVTDDNGENPVSIEFTQPLSYTDIAAPEMEGPDGSEKVVYVDSSGAKCPDQSVEGRFKQDNNYLRVGTIYTLNFSPTSQILSLQVATPKYVAKEIAKNIGSDTRGAFLKMVEGDRLEMITEDITLTTYDWRYNAQFDIVWVWQPTLKDTIPDEFKDEADQEKAYEDAAKAVIETPPPGQGTAQHPTSTVEIKPLEDNVDGKLTARVYYKETTFTDQNFLAEHTFNVTVRGKGIPASVVPTDQKYGLPGGALSVPSKDNPDFKPLPETLPKQINMDVFRGGIAEYTKPGTGACDYQLQLNMGEKNARSLYAVVTLEEPDEGNLAANANLNAVTLFTTSDKNVMEPYTPGAQIVNPKASNDYADEGTKPLLITAAQPGTVKLKIEYYASVNNQPRLDSTYTTTIIVADSSPSTDSTLSSLVLRDAKNKEPAIDFGFDPVKSDYQRPVIQLPYVYEEYNFTPAVNEEVAREKPITVRAWDSNGKPAAILVGTTPGAATPGEVATGDGTTSTTTVRSGTSLRIRLKEDKADKSKNMVGNVYWISFRVEAADPRSYTEYVVCVTRVEPSEDASLQSLGVYLPEDTENTTNLITGFNPETNDYLVTVPYSTKLLRVRAMQNFPRAEVAYRPELKAQNPLSLFGAKEYIWLEDLKETGEFEGVSPLPYFNIDVTPEINVNSELAGGPTGHYRVFVNRLPPSEEARMSALSIVDAADTEAEPQPLTYTPDFNADNDGPYRVTDGNAVPYSTSAVRFKVTPMDPLVSAIRIYNKDKTKLLTTIENPNVYSEPVSLTARSTDLVYNEFVVELVAEAGDGRTGAELAAVGRKEYYTEYKVQIERAEANTDADLLSVALNDQDGAALKMFAFHRDEKKYDITVPYAVRSVSFTAKLSDPNASIQLKDSENLIHSTGLSYDALVSERPTPLYKLNDPGKPRTFDLIVTAEDGSTTKTYSFRIDREPPSNDALLKKLTVDGLTEDGISPVFKPHDTDYSGTVAEGAEGIHITATTNDKNATVMIGTLRDGKLEGAMQVDSGQLSELVELLEIDNQLGILVTAEDGKTTMLYKLALYNQNLVDKTSNADLEQLRVERGVMTPDFKAAVQNYEVAVKEDTYSVDIIPKTDDPLAQIKVLTGTRELGDYNGNYALALTDGENQVTIQVTSPDETQVKEYNLTIYRNQEDALKTLKPLTAEDLDFETEENPIIVSVTEYPRVESSVFNELKKHPEKTIIFQGLDYSLTFNAANLNTVIPTREIYDFDMSFSSPAAEEIRQHMGQWSANAELMGDLVMIYFDYHGDLPGPAMLNIKLGNKYGAQTLFWHYYNREEKRIDFYGTLRSNAQGTISVPVNHFSTYLVTRGRAITGAENYSNTLSQIRATIGSKQNPTTGEDECAPGDGGAPGDGT